MRRLNTRLYVINSQETNLALRQAIFFAKVTAGREAEAPRVLASSGPPAVELSPGELDAINMLRAKLQQESDTMIIFADDIKGEAATALP